MTRIRSATIDDAAAVAAIHNVAIAERSATFDTRPRSVEDTALRIAGADAARHPLLVACDDDGVVLGWAGLSGYRPRECYAGIAEVSVYLAPNARGRGIGRQLLQALIHRAGELGHWKLLSRVFLFNTGSRALCRSLGFREVGIYEKHAQLDGQWLDVVIVERLLLDDAPGTGANGARASDPHANDATTGNPLARVEAVDAAPACARPHALGPTTAAPAAPL